MVSSIGGQIGQFTKRKLAEEEKQSDLLQRERSHAPTPRKPIV